jgi:hypothetical protein
MGREMVRRIDFPFVDGRFPADLGAVVQRTVLDGQLPARYVAHTADNDWVVGDEINDPNLDGASVAAHMRHVVDKDSTLESLATLPPGFQARRAAPEQPWTIEPFRWLADDERFEADM